MLQSIFSQGGKTKISNDIEIEAHANTVDIRGVGSDDPADWS